MRNIHQNELNFLKTMYSKTLFGLDQNKRLRSWTIEVEGNRYRSISGLVDGEKVTSEWSEAFGKNLGKVNATTDEEQAQKTAERLIQIRRELGYHDTPEEAAKGKSYFQPMLAGKWDAVKSKVKYPVLVQSKLDGIRLVLTKEGMVSRNGKPILSAPHIHEAALKSGIFDAYPDLILDGELYCHDLNQDFNRIISLVRKSKPTAEDLAESAKYIQFWCYDVPSCPENNYKRDLFREELFEQFLDREDIKHNFQYVESHLATSEAEVDELLEQCLKEGYEGAIIRMLDGLYENRRSKNLLKYKKFTDEEFRIIRVEEGRGNLAGKAGRIVVDVDGVKVAAGLKFSHEDAEEIWQNRDSYIGKTCTVRYFNRTEDGSLRFPKAVAIAREDYE